MRCVRGEEIEREATKRKVRSERGMRSDEHLSFSEAKAQATSNGEIKKDE
jgi:hypothetical protein